MFEAKKCFVVLAFFVFAACSQKAHKDTLKAELAEQIPPVPRVQKKELAGVEREWRLFIPSSYRKGKAVPLVLNLHGTGGTPERQENLSQFEPLAEEEGFIVVAPAAKFISPHNGRVTWNVDQHKSDINDVAFIKQLIEELSKEYSIDKRRIYSTGFSGGGRMSSRLACDLSDTIAAIAPVAGVRFPENCSPSRSVPVVTFHGKKDGVNHYVHQDGSAPYWRMGVEEALSAWIKNNRCDQSANEQAVSAALTKLSYQACKSDIIFYRSETSGHTWPGSPLAETFEKFGMGKTDAEISATKLSWEFFKQHQLK